MYTDVMRERKTDKKKKRIMILCAIILLLILIIAITYKQIVYAVAPKSYYKMAVKATYKDLECITSIVSGEKSKLDLNADILDMTLDGKSYDRMIGGSVGALIERDNAWNKTDIDAYIGVSFIRLATVKLYRDYHEMTFSEDIGGSEYKIKPEELDEKLKLPLNNLLSVYNRLDSMDVKLIDRKSRCYEFSCDGITYKVWIGKKHKITRIQTDGIDIELSGKTNVFETIHVSVDSSDEKIKGSLDATLSIDEDKKKTKIDSAYVSGEYGERSVTVSLKGRFR